MSLFLVVACQGHPSPAPIGYTPSGFRCSPQRELTDSQYEKYISECGETDEKLYLLLPENPKEYSKLDNSNEDAVIVVSESEMTNILNAVKYVEQLCAESQSQLTTTRAKLSFVAKSLPDVFSKGTPYEIFHKNNTNIME